MSKLKIKGPDPLQVKIADEMWRKISQLRNDYISCCKLARETDSKKEDVYLTVEAGKALEQLRQLCLHQHCVCLVSEYSGSYSYDGSDAHKEHRICLCCGIDEYAWKPNWKVLMVEPFSRFEGKYPDQIKHPLSYLLSETVEVAEKEGYHYFGGR